MNRPPAEFEPSFEWHNSEDVAGSFDAEPDLPTASKGARGEPSLVLAVFGGLYVVWSVAWVLGIVAAPTQPASSLLDAIMFQFGAFLAMVASPIWLGVVWWLTNESKFAVRVAWLVAGLVLLVPLPLIVPVVFG